MSLTSLDLAGLLSALPLFSDLSVPERQRIAQGCQLKRLVRGGLCFRVNDPCDAFFIVVAGQVKLYVASPSGQEKVIEIINAGQSFAEALVFLGKPHIVNAEALVDTVLVCVSKQAVLAEVANDPNFSLHMLAGISKRLHGLIRDVEGYALQSGMQRLIGYLLRDVVNAADESEMGPMCLTVSLPASKAIVASRLSLTPEYFSHVLHELEAKGLIEIDKRDIRIFDVKQLANFGSH